MPRLAKVVNVLAIRQVKQGTKLLGSRIGFTLHSCQYVSSLFNTLGLTALQNEDNLAAEGLTALQIP